MQTELTVRRAKELVEAGFIGEPVQAYGNNTQPLLAMIPDPEQWRLDPELSGYETSVMDLGIYSINTARLILDRDSVSVTAQMSSPSEKFADVPDESASFTLVSRYCARRTRTPRATPSSNSSALGAKSNLLQRSTVRRRSTSKGEIRAEISATECTGTEKMREEFDYFADWVLSDEEIVSDGRHALTDMYTIQAIHVSTENDETVEI